MAPKKCTFSTHHVLGTVQDFTKMFLRLNCFGITLLATYQFLLLFTFVISNALQTNLSIFFCHTQKTVKINLHSNSVFTTFRFYSKTLLQFLTSDSLHNGHITIAVVVHYYHRFMAIIQYPQ